MTLLDSKYYRTHTDDERVVAFACADGSDVLELGGHGLKRSSASTYVIEATAVWISGSYITQYLTKT